MGTETAIIMAISMAASMAMSAQQAANTRKQQEAQNAQIKAQQDEAERLRIEGLALPEAEGEAVEEGRKRRLTLSKDEDQRRNSAVSLGGDTGERSPLVLSQQAAAGDQ